MAWRLLPTVLALAALAAVPAAGAGFSLGWDLIDCEYVIAMVPVPASRLAPFVPEGFRPGMVRNPLVDMLPDRLAQVGFEVDDCASGASVGGRISPMQYASIWTGAAPRPGLPAPIAYQPFVNFDTLVPDDERRALMQAAGLPARDGSIVIDDVLDEGAAHAVHVSWTMDGFGEVTIDAAGPRRTAPFGGKFLQYTESSTGELALWKTDYSAPLAYTYAGTVSFPEDSWLAEVFGATTLPARVMAGHWSYTNGSIAFPVG